jgi:dTDP-4-dehydrorhamnose 3,5-epimerase
MNVQTTEIPGVLHLQPKVWRDDRGSFTELFARERYAALGLPELSAQDNVSVSEADVLRGLHAQRRHPQAKLVTVLRGRVWDVAVDLRRGSPAYGRWVAVELSAARHDQLFIPEGCAHGFCVLEAPAVVHYKCSAGYQAGDEIGIRWNDPDLAIPWPVAAPSLSPKDAALPPLAAIAEDTLPRYRA